MKDTDLTIKITTAKDINENQWNSIITCDNIQFSKEYLHILENNLSNKFSYYYVQVFYSNQVIATTFFFIDNAFTLHGLVEGFFEKVYNRLPVKFKVLFLSSPVTEYSAIHIHESYMEFENMIINTVLRELEAFARKSKITAVVIKDHIKKYTLEHLDDKYTHVHFMPSTFIELDYDSFDSYLMALKKKWRANIRNKINNRNPELIVDVLPSEHLSSEDNLRCHDLYIQTMSIQKINREVLSKTYFEECANKLGDKCKMIIAKYNDKIIGFLQLIINKDNIVSVRMGMDYTYVRDFNLYYHLIYENIKHCIDGGKKILYIGQTCYRAKLEAGANLLPLHTHFRFMNPLLHKALRNTLKEGFKCYSELLFAENPSDILQKYNLSTY